MAHKCHAIQPQSRQVYRWYSRLLLAGTVSLCGGHFLAVGLAQLATEAITLPDLTEATDGLSEDHALVCQLRSIFAAIKALSRPTIKNVPATPPMQIPTISPVVRGSRGRSSRGWRAAVESARRTKGAAVTRPAMRPMSTRQARMTTNMFNVVVVGDGVRAEAIWVSRESRSSLARSCLRTKHANVLADLEELRDSILGSWERWRRGECECG